MRVLVPSLLCVCGFAAELPNLPVTEVVLYSSGVGYFAHRGEVDGQATSRLQFKSTQINDVLKSLVLQDLDGGTIGTVVYPSQDPLDKMLRSFQVDLRGNPSVGQLLAQLRGAAVAVAWQAEKISGTILGVESRTKILGDKQTVVVPMLALVTSGGIRQVPLDEVGGVTLADPNLQAELNRALAAVAGARDQDAKPVDLHFDGQGKRRVRVGYVVETPLWKVSYRLVLPTAKEPKAALQGWALIENQTDSDWNHVALSLVSGRPVSFIMDLYRPRYLQRPTVEQADVGEVKPVAYDAGMAAPAAPAPARAMEMKAKSQRIAKSDGYAYGTAMAAPDEAPMNIASSVASRAASSEAFGALFRYDVPAVDLPRQRSAMLPIITDPLTAERVSIYDQATLAKHPLAGALLTNSTGKHLLAGPVSVFDNGTYAGDAQIEALPAGEQRLVSFAVDIQVTADPQAIKEDQRIVSGKLVQGSLWLKTSQVMVQEYRFKNSADEGRALILAHPRHDGWELKDTPAPFERSADQLRFRVALPAAKETAFKVTEVRTEDEALMLLNLDADTMLTYANTGAIPPKVRAALQQAAALKAQEAQLAAQHQQRVQELATITADQNRLRENLRTVQQNTPYGQRLLTKLNDQETKVETLQAESERFQAEAEAKRQELAAFVAQLTLE